MGDAGMGMDGYVAPPGLQGSRHIGSHGFRRGLDYAAPAGAKDTWRWVSRECNGRDSPPSQEARHARFR